MDLDNLVRRATAEMGDIGSLRPVIEKELLHYEILFALDNARLLERLTFQGGTALRLCYGASRFSEDLDFVGGREFSSSEFAAIAEVVESSLGQRYGLEVRVKSPVNDSSHVIDDKTVTVSRWQIIVTTHATRPDLPKQRIRLEVANIPAYSSDIRPLRRNYQALPDGYEDLLLPVESIDEILCDKLISLVAMQEVVRYRDIWDLPWLQQQGGVVQADWVSAKILDYGVNDYKAKLEDRLLNLPKIVHGAEFSDQMRRFLPPAVIERTIHRPGFLDYVEQANRALLQEVLAVLE